MSDFDKLRLERELAKPGTYGESKVRSWDLETYKRNYDLLMYRTMRLREERDNLRVIVGRVRRANTFMEIPWHEIEALDV